MEDSEETRFKLLERDVEEIDCSIACEQRNQTVGTAAAGGHTVATNLASLADRFRPSLKVEAMGATVLRGLTGFLDLPHLASSGTATWVAECPEFRSAPEGARQDGGQGQFRLSTRGVLVLDGGTEFKPMSFSPRDAEFLDSRKLSNLDICRIWGVPPTAAGITDNATYSNSDQESRALVVWCLAPMARRIEHAMNAALLTTESRKTLFVEHDLAGLLRGDMKARYESYRIGREWGWPSPNEIRGWENMPEIEGGEKYLSPLNMTVLGERAPPVGSEEDA